MPAHTDIDEFIASELEYFRPMLERQQRVTSAQRRKWRSETVAERQLRVSKEVHQLAKGRVLYGPFADLSLSGDCWWGEADLGSQCLGLYEQEVLYEIVSLSASCSTFIDIGAADGYYAVGVLHAAYFKRAICFERSIEGQKKIAENWRINGSPGEIDILGCADSSVIQALPDTIVGNSLVLIDIEGGEFDLLSNEVLTKFHQATIIVEVHNWLEDFAAAYEGLLRRAADYFDIERLEGYRVTSILSLSSGISRMTVVCW